MYHIAFKEKGFINSKGHETEFCILPILCKCNVLWILKFRLLSHCLFERDYMYVEIDNSKLNMINEKDIM